MRGAGMEVKASFREVYCVRSHTIYLAFAHNIPCTRTQYTLLKHTIYLLGASPSLHLVRCRKILLNT